MYAVTLTISLPAPCSKPETPIYSHLANKLLWPLLPTPHKPLLSFSPSQIRELLPPRAFYELGALSSGDLLQQNLWVRGRSHAASGRKDLPEGRASWERIWLRAQGPCLARIFSLNIRIFRIKDRSVKRGRRHWLKPFWVKPSHSKVLKLIYLWLHFEVTNAFKWKLNAKEVREVNTVVL